MLAKHSQFVKKKESSCLTLEIVSFILYFDYHCSDNRRFQATNPNASGDQGRPQPQAAAAAPLAQQQRHTNGVLLKASQKDLESKYLLIWHITARRERALIHFINTKKLLGGFLLNL